MRLRFFIGVFLLLLVLTACGGGGGNTTTSASVQQVQITETDTSIGSSLTSFTAGTTYHFVVMNKGKEPHEFMIMPETMSGMKGMPMQDMDQKALAEVANINPGETKTLDYTFPSSTAGSHPEFACTMPGHYAAGMKQEVSVVAFHA